ncbi:MAG: cyclic nucleotide-binding domain-containing protein [Deltaproteobacteria bacterium]|jgi:CRP/FNR family cyclic AMP-dependent transcriptional regulator|nr:cyclic nucleotide-binding domain-containing protein [Deltaproteobacteria bacterium]MBW1747188.1 cyclic nucleotide-binding domain-containing protein [Deltaproteobacteria bacterium]MBW1827324.1 cyclic nucleotide-binding domain-containing protein [Deltaproteobacteria bacterium]MBW1968096.1 cyclic nucleotide-binding domain-containing protein [Deltaproteobacteria bacterium]MBW2157558.1 cyclic nucleotide-binding domain-containing protein [Deltaproteobacteria bacterium]
MFQTAIEEKYKDGDIIFEEGSSGDWIYVVESGAVEISKIMHGEKEVLLELGPGEIIGELGFITKMPRTATARAVGDTTVGIIDPISFEQEFNRLSPDFQAVLISLATRLKETTEALYLMKKISGKNP